MIDDYDESSGWMFFWYRLTRVFPDKFHRAVKRLCVCVCLSMLTGVRFQFFCNIFTFIVSSGATEASYSSALLFTVHVRPVHPIISQAVTTVQLFPTIAFVEIRFNVSKFQRYVSRTYHRPTYANHVIQWGWTRIHCIMNPKLIRQLL